MGYTCCLRFLHDLPGKECPMQYVVDMHEILIESEDEIVWLATRLFELIVALGKERERERR